MLGVRRVVAALVLGVTTIAAVCAAATPDPDVALPSATPTPVIFPPGSPHQFMVDFTLTRFVPNPSNNTAVNTTIQATIGVTPHAATTAYYSETVGGGLMTSEVWLNKAANTSTISVQWNGKGGLGASQGSSKAPVGSGSTCLTAALFTQQIQPLHDLTVFNDYAGFATYNGTVVWRGRLAHRFVLSTLRIYTDASPGVTSHGGAIGLWDGKGNVYQFGVWNTTAPVPSAPQGGGCRRVVTTERPGRPAWWLAAAKEGGVLAQDGGVAVLHGNDTYWMFGDTFLSKSSPACGWPGVSNTAMHVTQRTSPGGPVKGHYYTGTDDQNKGCAWFFTPVAASRWNSPHSRRIWPSSGTTVLHGTPQAKAVVWVSVEDAVDPGMAVAVSHDPSGPPAYTLVGATADGGYTNFPIQQPGLLSMSVDEYGFLNLVDFAIPSGFNALNRYTRLVRVAAADVTEPTAYEFWTGEYEPAATAGGAPTPLFARGGDAATVSPPFLYGVNNPQASTSYSDALGLYVMSTTETSQDMYLRVSPWPTGPWSAHVPLYSHAHVADKDGVYVYCAYLHPELQAPGSGNLTLTFSRNGGQCGFPTPCNDWMLDVEFQ